VGFRGSAASTISVKSSGNMPAASGSAGNSTISSFARTFRSYTTPNSAMSRSTSSAEASSSPSVLVSAAMLASVFRFLSPLLALIEGTPLPGAWEAKQRPLAPHALAILQHD
jgi:hypothetical protein